MAIANLVGGPFDGETLEVPATARTIDVHRCDGTYASYVPTRAGSWHYVGASRDTSAAAAAAPRSDAISRLAAVRG